LKSITITQIAEGSTLLINKPLHWTSFDVVNKLKGLLRKPLGKKFKIGHAGTLDPLATGLLIVCTGKNTKIIQDIQDAKKTYHATFFIGATRPSFDKETEIDATFPIAHITAEKIQSTAISFIGKQAQMPPIFSALKKDGKPIYLKARKGIEVTVEARQIDIEKFDITMINLPIVEATIVCSKGTYIRSIAKDFGAKLESGAYLDGLVRTGIGENSVADAWNMEDLVSHIQNQINVSAD
jgi:tRNA pseudouridine55 synthase